MSARKPLAALAAVAAALALAGPAASGSAAASAPAARTASVGLLGAGGGFLGLAGPLQPGSLPCLFLVGKIQFALLIHNTALANFFSNVFLYSGCGGAAV